MSQRNNFEGALDDISSALFRYFCCSFSSATADDLVQDTLIRLIDKIDRGQFDSTRGNLRMYAFGIAHFVRLEAFRHRDPYDDKEIDEGASDALALDEKVIQAQEIKRLRAAIRTLSASQQEVIALYLDKDLSHEEISLILDQPIGTIKSHMSRAKEALRNILRKE